MTEIVTTKLKYPDTIRHNIGMYLNSTADYSTPFRETRDNGSDELLNGYADKLVLVNRPRLKAVIDNGRGIPTEMDPDDHTMPITKAIVTETHVGSKFDNSDEISAGTHGVGSAAVNAVSDRFVVIAKLTPEKAKASTVEICKAYKKGKNDCLVLDFKRGVLQTCGVMSVEAAAELADLPELVEHSDFMTAVTMVPDLTLYASDDVYIDLLPLAISLKRQPKAKILVNNKPVKPFDFRTDITTSELLNDQVIPFEFKFNDYLTIEGEFAIRKDSFTYEQTSLVNLVNTTSGGYIEAIIKNAIGRSLVVLNSALKPKDAEYGLSLFVNCFTALKTSYSSQTKERLSALGGSASDRKIVVREFEDAGISADDIKLELEPKFLVDAELKAAVLTYFTELMSKRTNSKTIGAWIQRTLAYKAAMSNVSKEDFVKSKIIMGDDTRKRAMTEGARVYEALSKKSSERELYITEGTSASGLILETRCKKTQSVLPLRGKMQNSSNMDASDLCEHAELLGIVNTIGCGVGNITDITKARYSKIILATDLDVDGKHIRNLIMAIFKTHIPELIAAGLIYTLESPYYKVTKGGNTTYYMADQKDMIDFENSKVVRRKGLGSYTKEETYEFMTNKETRVLHQITYSEKDKKITDETCKLLYSSLARKNLMKEIGVIE